MKKLTVRQHAAICTTAYVLAAVFAIASYIRESMDGPRPMLWLAVILVVVGIAWRAVFVKCPYCGDGLTGSRTVPKLCPSCGNDLSVNPTEGGSK